MRRQLVAVAACAALLAPMLAAPAVAGGRLLPHRGIGAHAVRTVPGARVAPDVRPKSAFGSPGGFPFRDWEHYPRRTVVVPSGHRARRHAHAGRLPHTVFLYTPAALYGFPAEPPAPVVDVSPVIHASPIVYVSPTVVVAPAVEPPPPLPPQPTIVEHPTGRYELRGDGVTTPYVWVWIPNPPPGPPAAPAPSSGEPPAGSVPASRSQVYRWTDDEGHDLVDEPAGEHPGGASLPRARAG